ncbi:MlaA family lipoprotein [Kiloniella laminariae]|uniref:MlaA family lipoprotein n=1 Tax=Kiloniella laminariae TaxID=454162 RepID=UPI0012FC4651|nr:VacJ family lipoprotein [Kiloniella laminariae]
MNHNKDRRNVVGLGILSEINSRLINRVAALAAVAVLVAGCASQPNSALQDDASSNQDDQWAQADASATVEAGDNDPIESVNRFIFGFNKVADTLIFKPVAQGYRFVVPEPVRDVVRNFIRNTYTPVILANDLLQGDIAKAENTFARFLINTTLGAGGLADVAEVVGHSYVKEDFGQTLGTWGVSEGPYLVLPILGPSNVRDGVGMIADTLMDPLTYIASTEVLIGRRVTDGIDTRSRNIETVEELERDSIDFYARVRSLYHQKRENEINDGEYEPTQAPGLTEIFPEDDQVSDLAN